MFIAEMSAPIWRSTPSSSLRADRWPAPVASAARISSRLTIHSSAATRMFSYSSTRMRRKASSAASSRLRLARVFSERRVTSSPATGAAYMMRYRSLTTGSSRSLLSERVTAS